MNKPLNIGKLQLKTNLLLAPIAGYAELPFRRVTRKIGGVGLAFTSLISPMGLRYKSVKTFELTTMAADDRPLGIQFFGGEESALVDAVRWSIGEGYDVIDFNMGCSVPKVVNNGGGSGLLREPDRAVALVGKIIEHAGTTPVTVKLRLGWDDSALVAPSLAKRFEQMGVSAITIHGRTAKMKFGGKCRLEGIREVVAACEKIPVIGNGDVRTPDDAESMIRETACAGVMIGRAALSEPWIFRDTWIKLTTGTIPAPPSAEEKVAFMREHFEGLITLFGEKRAVSMFRKSGPFYAKGIGHKASIIRTRMPYVASREDFEQIVADFLSTAR